MVDHSAAQSPSKGPLRVGALPDCEAYLTEPSTTPVSPGHGSSGLFPLPTYLSYNPTTRARPFQRTHSFSRPLIVIIFTSLHSQFIEFDACTHPPPPVHYAVSCGCVRAPEDAQSQISPGRCLCVDTVTPPCLPRQHPQSLLMASERPRVQSWSYLHPLSVSEHIQLPGES